MNILVDGEEGGRLAASDRGFQYGDGVFETLRLREGAPQLWGRHWERLCRGLDRLGIPRVAERDCLDDLRRVAPGGWSMAKLIVTRGSGPRGYAIPERMRPTRVAMGGEALRPGEDGSPLQLGVCRTRAGPSPVPGCKHLNRLENVLARIEWGPGWGEGLMLDGRGQVVCGTQSNVFFVEGQALVTPPLLRAGIPGTRRAWLLERARRARIEVREEPLSLARARAAETVFLSNTRMGLRRAVWVGENENQHGRAADSGLPALISELGVEMNALD
jgi:4-amino-4-deoxychorismate lyase